MVAPRALSSPPHSYLGIDLSTQSLTFTVVSLPANTNRAFVALEESISYASFGDDGLRGGGRQNCLAWLRAMDLMAARLASSKPYQFLKGSIKAVSFSSQQHGTCWLKCTEVNGEEKDFVGLTSMFANEDCPIWLCSEADKICEKLNAISGQAAKVTGSVFTPRFSGPVMRHILDSSDTTWRTTKRVMLISEFLGLLATEKDAQVLDESDGAGTNLFDLASGDLSEACVEALFGEEGGRAKEMVASRLCSSDTVLGHVGPFFGSKFGLENDVKVVVGTGDNPSSFCSSNLGVGELMISLGTSDTVLAVVSRKTGGKGVVSNFADPRGPAAGDKSFVRMLCFANGGKTRQDYCSRYCGGDWGEFSKICEGGEQESWARGREAQRRWNLVVDTTEITPPIPVGVYRSDASGRFSEVMRSGVQRQAEAEVRSLVETRLMSMHLNSQRAGMHDGSIKRVLVTGGGSKNCGVCQMIADCFECPVFVQSDGSGGASYGAAMRALWVTERQGREDKSWAGVCGEAVEAGWKLACEPDVVSSARVREERESYERFEDEVVRLAKEKDKEESKKVETKKRLRTLGVAGVLGLGTAVALIIFLGRTERRQGGGTRK